jgi:RNA polymerase sigma-70 factor (ECF subfamily)
MNDDADVVKRVLDGDVGSFKVLVDRYQGPLFSLAVNILGRSDGCEDVVQDAFLAAYSGLRNFDPKRGAFSTWIYSIARYKCLASLRKRRPTTTDSSVDDLIVEAAKNELLRDEQCQILDAALDSLPLDQKTAFVLAELSGLSYEEIASIEGVPLGTIKSRINRAKEKLREVLRDKMK